MNRKKYIHVDSSQRNRGQYPNPAEFAVNTGNELSVSTASIIYPTPTDGTYYAYPISNPAPNVLNIDYTFSSDETFLREINIPRTDNVFTGNILEIFNDDEDKVTVNYYPITKSAYNNQQYLLERSTVYVAINLLVAALDVNPPNPYTAFYLSPTSSDIDKYYINKTIVINGETRIIVNYDGGRRLAYVNEPLSTIPVAGDVFEIYGSEQWSLETDRPITTNAVNTLGLNLSITDFIPSSTGWSSYWLAYSPSLEMVVAPYDIRTTIDGGRNWVDTPYTGKYGTGICWSDNLGIFVIVFDYDIGGGVYAITYNGTTWTLATVNVAGTWAGVAYSRELNLFVSVDYTTAMAMTSPDGLVWTGMATADVNGLNFWSIAYSPTLRLFATVSYSNSANNIQTFDGTTWTVRTNPTGDFLDNVIWVPFIGKFVTTGGINTCLTSDDGVNWDIQTIPTSNGRWYSLTYSDELSMIVAQSLFSTVVPVPGVDIVYSRDGINWTIAETTGYGAYEAIYNIIWVPNTYNFLSQAQFPVDAAIIASPSMYSNGIYPSHLINNPQYTRNLYRIRDETIPILLGTATGLNSPTTIQFPSSASSTNDFYTGKWIWITNQDRLVHSGNLVQVGFPTAYNFFTQWQIRQVKITPAASAGIIELGMKFIVKTQWSDGNEYLLVSYVTDRLGETGNLLDEFYILCGFPKGLTIGDEVWIYTENPNLNQYRQIISYNGTTKVATFLEALPSAIMTGDTYEVLDTSTTSDNLFELDNTNQPVCYELDLQCLTLPNLPLTTSTGNRIAFYPYVYVEFKSAISKPYTNALQSNVPNISDVIFKVPVYAVNNPNTSAFVVLDGRGMVHTVKFKADDVFIIRILLPNGELFTTVQEDTLPPVVSIAGIQISLTIGFKRLV